MQENTYTTDFLIAGGGTSGVCAAIQAARMGLDVIVIEETAWLGGMLSAAGVSAIDGNHLLPAGLWGEFRDKIYAHYGGADKVETGWISNTLFEPHIAAQIFSDWLSEYQNITVFNGWRPIEVTGDKNCVTGARFINSSGNIISVLAPLTLDATEFSDVLALAGCPYSSGRESRSETGEKWAPEFGDDVIQDITWVATLKDFGHEQPSSAPPAAYDPQLFWGCCKEWSDSNHKNLPDAQTMLNYGKLPNKKYMINWPNAGNDYYANLLESSYGERQKHFLNAQEKTKAFVHFIREQLGFKNLALADDEFPSDNRLALLPYVRESRRVKGLSVLTLNDLIDPYKNELYQSGIAVGNYPVDHHHSIPEIAGSETFPPLPAFTIPYGCLVPQSLDGMIVAEKNISVTHLVNGCTRLQPVVMQLGQAAGAAAALCIQKKIMPRDLNVRELQEVLLGAGGWLLPFTDLDSKEEGFKELQKLAVCGLLKGQGRPKDWANEFLIFPQNIVKTDEYEIINKRLSSVGNTGNWNEAFNALRKRSATRVELSVFLDEKINLLEIF